MIIITEKNWWRCCPFQSRTILVAFCTPKFWHRLLFSPFSGISFRSCRYLIRDNLPLNKSNERTGNTVLTVFQNYQTIQHYNQSGQILFFFLNMLKLTWMTLFFLLKTLNLFVCFTLVCCLTLMEKSKAKVKTCLGELCLRLKDGNKKRKKWSPTHLPLCCYHNYAQVFCLFGLAESTL